uniref:Alpha-bungarotoxin deletion n=1 Tax=Bungarus multicinctus TaxID=8616 RepID=Q9YH67_BUNMU|nr:alpha-bungarotoxin deletion precursor [Bungarus multicinctus]
MKTLLLSLVVVTIVCLDLGSSRGKVVELGCAATCPSKKPYEEVTCCSTDKCNPHPKQRPG